MLVLARVRLTAFRGSLFRDAHGLAPIETPVHRLLLVTVYREIFDVKAWHVADLLERLLSPHPLPSMRPDCWCASWQSVSRPQLYSCDTSKADRQSVLSLVQ